MKAVRPRNAALQCFEHYRAVVEMVDSGRGEEGLSAIESANVYLEQVKADCPEHHNTVMRMLSSHYGVSWDAMK